MKTYLIAATVAALAAPAAHALTIDETDIRDTGSSGLILSFDGYQGSGTVSEVVVEYFGEIDNTIRTANNGSDAATFSATLTSSFSFGSSDVTLPGAPQVTLSGGTGIVTLGAGEAQDFSVTDSEIFSDTVTGADIGGYLTPFEIFLFTSTELTEESNGFFAGLGVRQQFARMTVEYKIADDVSVVPLPAAAWMLLAGLASLLTFRRFNKA